MTTILENIPVLVYVGQDDVMCNIPSVASFVENIAWSGADVFFNTQMKPWTYNGKVAGMAKTYQNLSFAVVNAAGQFVPYYQPEVACAMFTDFINNGHFGGQ